MLEHPCKPGLALLQLCTGNTKMSTKMIWKAAFLYLTPRACAREDKLCQHHMAAVHPGPGNWDKPETWALNWKTSEEKQIFSFLVLLEHEK